MATCNNIEQIDQRYPTGQYTEESRELFIDAFIKDIQCKVNRDINKEKAIEGLDSKIENIKFGDIKYTYKDLTIPFLIKKMIEIRNLSDSELNSLFPPPAAELPPPAGAQQQEPPAATGQQQQEQQQEQQEQQQEQQEQQQEQQQPPAATGQQQQQPPAATGQQQPPAATGQQQQQPAATGQQQQQPAATGQQQQEQQQEQQQPPAATGQPPAATGQPPAATGQQQQQPPAETGQQQQQEKQCSEKEIVLPKNDAATCWWLSINLALFHKKRREIDTYFAKDESKVKDEDKLGDKIKGNFKQIYDHYTNSAKKETNDLLAYRSIEEMKRKFNGIEFDITGSKFQDASEYILTLFRYLNIPSFRTIEITYNNIYDIYTNLAFNGKITTKIELTAEEKLKGMKDTQQDKYNNNKNTETIIYYFPRRFNKEASEFKPVEYEISVLNYINIPLRTDEKEILVEDMNDESLKTPITQKYKLDAIVAVKTNHYFAYVNCTGTEKWLKYDAMSEGKLTKEYETLDKLLESKEDAVSKKANILFYSKVLNLDFSPL